ncbi:MAG: Glu-tRNA(Gln) amidotransferase subunit GatE [archaeon]
MENPNYAKLGLKAGLEVHQQLDTGKLFMRTPSILSDEFDFTIERKLRPVASELGEYDKTAIDAFKRNETFYYSGKKNNISLIELDEEPPQPMDEEALKTILEIALLCKSNPISKLITMRKTVIDGSNTSAFQRTALVSFGGGFEIKTNGKNKKIGVQTIILEEDAARPIKKEQGKVYYNLDRLGIPLVELATDPDIRSPEEAIATAAKIGEIMRLTCKTKRGKGTIRQDVNVSIAEGNRCEIKGCQELELIGTVVKKEAERQIDLINLKKKLNEKFGKMKNKKELFSESKEISQIFTNSECKFVKGRTCFGMKLKEMKGILREKIGAKRFGSELSAYAKATGVTGLIHRDELPNYGISEKETEIICKTLNCGAEDNFVLIVAEKEKALKAFEAIKERIITAFEKVPSETRGALEDGSSEYQRPLSGEARMYPETDIPSKEINEKYLSILKKALPKSVAEREKLYSSLGLSTNHVEEMKLSNYARFFEETIESGANAKTAATLLLQTLTELKRKGIEVEKVSLGEIKELLLAEAKGKISKNNLGEAIEEIAKGKTLEEILSAKKTQKTDLKEIETKIIEVVTKNSSLVKAKGLGAIGPLMGDLMKEPSLKGIDGKILSEILKKEINARK